MTMKQNRSLKALNARVAHGIKRVRDRLGFFFDAIALLLIGAVFLGILMRTGLAGPDDWASITAVFVAGVLVIFFSRRAALREAMLVEVTMSYLIRGDKALLDDLLIRLIGGWPLPQAKLGDKLFDLLDKLIVDPDWEMRRLIAEALPALGEIDVDRTMAVAATLRDDWEPCKWKSDVRRRVVEALILSSRPGSLPLISRVRPKEVIPLLELRERDQIYVAMAIAEVLHAWKSTRPTLASQLKDDLLKISMKVFSSDEHQAICDTFDLLETSQGKDVTAVLERLEQMSNSTNLFVQIAASRNVLVAAERFPERTLDFMLSFIGPDRHRNVRRTTAKEQPVDFLIRMVGHQTYRAKAEEMIWKLFRDDDEIIRIATFDRAERLKGRNQALLLKICEHILEHEASQRLVERARRVKLELSGEE